MAWNIEHQRKGNKIFVYFKNTHRVKGVETPRTPRIYIGPEEVAIKILGDLAIKHLIDEKRITYGGEKILEKIADSLNFENILVKYAQDKRASKTLKNLIILMALNKASKRRLFMKILNNSILGDSTDLKYLEEVYMFMDLVYDNLGDIMYDLFKAARCKYDIDLKYLIVDATRFKLYKDEETGMIKLGYAAQKRRDLPQINIFLGVNGQQIPFFVSAHPGNTSDVVMFEDFLKTIRSKYRILNNAPIKIIIMDQGNVNEDTIRYLRWLKRFGFEFVVMVRGGSIGRFIEILEKKGLSKDDLDLIYTKEISKNKETKTYGKLIEEKVYKRLSRVLVCYNPDVEETKNKTLDGKIHEIEQKVELLNGKGGSLDNKQLEVSLLVGEKNLKQAIAVIKNEKENKLELERKKDYLFAWDDVPGKGNRRFRKFIGKNLKIDLVKNAKIEKTDDNKTITVTNGKNVITLKLNDAENNVVIKIGGVETYGYCVERYEGKLNVYEKDKIDVRREKFGFFALFTHHKDLSAEDIITIYKNRDLVEKMIEVLDTCIDVGPIYHSEDRRIETHTIFKIFGCFFVSLLKTVLKNKKMDYSFEELLYTIKLVDAVVGYYEHEIFKGKRLYVTHPDKMSEELTKVFRILKIKIPKYDVKLMPTI